MAELNNIIQRVWAGLGREGAASGDFAFRVSQNLFPVMEGLVRSLAGTHLREYFLTDPATTTVTLSGGDADLSDLVETGVLLDCLRFGTITHSSSNYPLQWRNSQGQAALPSAYGDLFIGCWLQGNILHTISGDELTGDLNLSVPRAPGLDGWPEKLEGKLVDALIMRMGATEK